MQQATVAENTRLQAALEQATQHAQAAQATVADESQRVASVAEEAVRQAWKWRWGVWQAWMGRLVGRQRAKWWARVMVLGRNRCKRVCVEPSTRRVGMGLAAKGNGGRWAGCACNR